MFKGFEYNKNYRKIGGRSIYEQEVELLHEFLASEHDNIRFEYTTEREAVNARQSLTVYAKKNKMPLKIMQRENFVFAIDQRRTKQCR